MRGTLSCPKHRRNNNLAPILEAFSNGGTILKSFPHPKVGVVDVLQCYPCLGCEKGERKALVSVLSQISLGSYC